MTMDKSGMRRAIAAWLFLLAGCIAAPAFGDLTAGKEYLVLAPTQPVESGDKIEVIEFFSYGCPFCNEAFPLILKWRETLPADVMYRRVPVVRPDKWAPYARTYYTLEALDKLKLHRHVFDTIHIDNLNLNDEKTMFDWAQRNYIDRQKFIDIYKSPETTAKVARAQQMTEDYLIARIPAFVIDGKYITTSGMAGSLNALLPTVDKLIAQARAERAARK
jgi:protein dithiol oxidoreductase (disulfide-forming)